MATYLITYKKRGEKDTRLAEMPNEFKLLSWISKNASYCDTVLIQREDGCSSFLCLCRRKARV